MDLTSHFAVSAASFVGREHARLHRNNQDAVAVFAQKDVLAAAVCDGCGEGGASEVAARLSAGFLARWLGMNALRLKKADVIAERAVVALVHYLGQVALPFGDGEPRAAFVREHLLSTALACVVDSDRTLVFGVGDGAFAVNGQLTRLDAGLDNAPAYPAYRVVDAQFVAAAQEPRPILHFSGATAEVHSLLLGTDGTREFPAEKLSALSQDARYQKNPTLLQRHLVVLGERERLLHDDTSLVLLQRRRAAAMEACA